MQLRAIFIISIAILAVSEGNIISSDKGQRADECAACDNAEELLSILNSTVEDELSASIYLLSLKRNQAASLANSIETATWVSIQQTSSRFSREAADIKAAAEEMGIEAEVVDECVATSNDELTSLVSTVESEIANCVDSTLKQSQRLIYSTINDLENVRITVQYLDLQIKQCRLLTDSEECALNVIEQILIEEFNLPAKIREDTSRTTAVVDALESTFQECSSDRVGSITAIGNAQIEELKACVSVTKI